MNEYIQEFNNSIPDILCDEIMQMFELEKEGKNIGRILSGVDVNVKDTKDFVIPKNDSKWNKIEKFLNEELQRCLIIYTNDNQLKNHNFFVKDLMIQKYQKQKGKYIEHNDFHCENNAYRVVTFLWYLNDVDVGGETSFWNGKTKIIPKKGKLLLFPASWCYPHEGKMPISNDKYIITNWIYQNSYISKD